MKEQLIIITDDWKIVNYSEFYYVAVIKNESENIDDDRFVLAGILDEEENFITLAVSEDINEITQSFNKIALALDGKKDLVDLRRVEPTDSITMLKNLSQKPGSEDN